MKNPTTKIESFQSLNMKTTAFISSFVAFLIAAALAADPLIQLDHCDVSWDKPGVGSQDSMPLGNGDIGLNVWTEANGDLLFYISKSDAWTDNDAGGEGLAKVGKVRVSLSPNPFASGKFRQTLVLRDGEVTITGGSAGSEVTLNVRVDANLPVVRVEAVGEKPLEMRVALEPYRLEPAKDLNADTLVKNSDNHVIWYYRNLNKKAPQAENLTFGAMIEGKGMVRENDTTLKSAGPAKECDLAVHVLTTQAAKTEDWLLDLHKQAATTDAVEAGKALKEHKAWWDSFWHRSWIFVSGGKEADTVTRGYALQRYITACAGRGAYPIKFNGSIFVVDNPTLNKGNDKVTGQQIVLPVTADHREWGGQYWFQNTRAMYWPRLASGDFDMMRPLFRMYGQVLKNNASQVREYYGHDGSYMAETARFYGGIPNIKAGEAGNYTKHYFTPVLELSAMMLDYYDYTGDKAFLAETLLPTAQAGLTFFKNHFPHDETGRLRLEPDNAIEMYWAVRNPLPDIAGLHWVLTRLLELPNGAVDSATRDGWKQYLAELPPVPVGMKNGVKMLLPYEEGQEAKAHNFENPELYAVYPFRLYGLGKPDIGLAKAAYESRIHKAHHCWGQDPMQAAFLGLTNDAKQGVITNFSQYDKRLHFPAFWNKGHDYEPDQDNGGNGEQVMQKMIMQCDGTKILLLPAWPENWNADFKLHAPLNTTVEGCVTNGNLVSLNVTPASRRADVVVQAPFKLPPP